MDIQLKKKPWYVRYKYHLLAATLFAALSAYALTLALTPRRVSVDLDTVKVAEVCESKFLEYVEPEGVVHPILTLKVNTRVSGNVERIVAEEGSMVRQGDTILLLTNPDMQRDLEEMNDALQKQLVSYREQEIEMEQKSLTLRQKTLQNAYELARLQENFKLDEEEFSMGIKSKAQLKVARDEYEYKQKAARLEREYLQHESAVAVIRRDMLLSDREREIRKYRRSVEQLQDLVVRAPAGGQLSFVKVTPGQRVGSGEQIGEIKVLDEYKVHTTLSEYYIDRLSVGLPATERKQRVEQAMDRMAIAHRAKHFPQQLSGGQQQRTAIARAVVMRPRLILADEPTGNLDSRNGMEVMNLLRELHREGTTIVMVTHSLRDAGYADRTIQLFDGRMASEVINP